MEHVFESVLSWWRLSPHTDPRLTILFRDNGCVLCIERTLLWCHNDRDGVSNHQPHDCLLRRRSKKTSKFRVTELCAGNSPVTGGFPAQKASYPANVFIWWRHHESLLHKDIYLTLQSIIVMNVKDDGTTHQGIGKWTTKMTHSSVTSLSTIHCPFISLSGQ